MNKKYLNGILSVLLIFIWGSVIYKYFVNKNTIEQHYNEVDGSLGKIPNLNLTKDIFELELNDRDPFGISKRKKASSIANSKPNNIPKKKTEKTPVMWPIISYYGFVRGEHKATRLALIKVNNRLSRKREGETIDDVSILKAYSDSIKVLFNKQTKIIKKINEKI